MKVGFILVGPMLLGGPVAISRKYGYTGWLTHIGALQSCL